MKQRLVLAALALATFGCGAPQRAPAPPERISIVERPITFSPRRTAATLEYIRSHYDPTAATIDIDPRMIVVHDTEIATFDATFRAFDRELLTGRPEIAGGGDVNVSAHFVVDADGTVYRLMPETRMARHVIGLNHLAIGIENVGYANRLSEAQLRANARLVRDLKARFPRIEFLIGHYEYQRFRGSPLWKELDPGYAPTTKSDPGERFMERLRAELRDLGLKAIPSPR